MLRVIVQTNAAAAQSYYRGTGEYYTEGQEQAGEWGGLAAKRLGLEGRVEKDAFDALCENRDPRTGERITARTKTVRRVGFDLNFHVPKSVSVVYGLTGDRLVLEAFQNAVRETLEELEQATQTRVRRGGRDESRTTGNLVYALFAHATARPVGGIPDPHLHAHAFTFNLTFDEVEKRWKAIELGDVYKNAPYYEAVFHARYAKKLADLGFDISRTATGWEIGGIPERVRKLFSRRTEQIETLAEELGILDPDVKSRLGSTTRERKQLAFTLEELRSIWRSRLTPTERETLDHVLARKRSVVERDSYTPNQSIAFAVAHCFERVSVVAVKRLLAVALRHSVGQATPGEIHEALKAHNILIRNYQGEELATTQEVLAEESRILSFAKKGRNTCRPFVLEDRSIANWLSDQQRNVVRHVLSRPDRVILIRGVAGSGKTTLIRECVNAIEGEGKTVLILAPSAEASRGVLRTEGFVHADTVARFLRDERFQNGAINGVIWIDEAGLLGLKTLDAVFQLAEKVHARVILSGDDRQHHSVERGTPFSLLQRLAGLEPASVHEIRRQKGRYKEAVELLSEGQTVAGFDLLDRHLGWVKELPDDDREKGIATEYTNILEAGKSVLVVSPTHAEGAQITKSIRDVLRGSGRLAHEERDIFQLVARDLTLAERQEARFYREGDVIEFHSQAKGVRPGARYTVTTVGNSSLTTQDERGRDTAVPLHLAERFHVYTVKSLSLAVGDCVRITKNSKSLNGTRLDNGTLSKIVACTNEGGLELETGDILPSHFGHLAHGYVVTSHASQGKTVDRVLIVQSSESFCASSREQFYVSVSRGRESVTVYTDDKASLRDAIERSDPNLSATELLQEHEPPIAVRQAWLARRLQLLKQSVENGITALVPSFDREHPLRAR